MAGELEKAFKDFRNQVMKSAIGSVAKITPPSTRKSSNPKEGIRKLRKRIKEQFDGDNIIEAAPAAIDTIYTFGAGYNKSGIYVKKKGKSRKTIIKTISDGKGLVDWYISHSKLDRYSHRKKSDRAMVFVSGKNVINAAIRQLQLRAGNLISGWQPFAKYFGGNIDKYLLKGNFDYNGRVEEQDGIVYAWNYSQSGNPKLEKYVQYLIDRDLPKEVEFHTNKALPFLISSIKKKFNLTMAEAKAVVTKINI